MNIHWIEIKIIQIPVCTAILMIEIVRDTINNDHDGKMNIHWIQIKLNLIFIVICQGRFNRLPIWQHFQTNLEICTLNCLEMHNKFLTYPGCSILTLSVAISKKTAWLNSTQALFWVFPIETTTESRNYQPGQLGCMQTNAKWW